MKIVIENFMGLKDLEAIIGNYPDGDDVSIWIPFSEEMKAIHKDLANKEMHDIVFKTESGHTFKLLGAAIENMSLTNNMFPDEKGDYKFMDYYDIEMSYCEYDY